MASASVKPSKISHICSVLVVVVLIRCWFQFRPATATNIGNEKNAPADIVHQVCGRCGGPAICYQQLTHDPRTTNDTLDLLAVEVAVINTLKTNTFVTLDYIGTLIPSFEEPVKGFLEACRGYYSTALMYISQALEICEHGDYACLTRNCEYARSYIVLCDARFSTSPGTEQLLFYSIREFADFMCIIRTIPSFSDGT